MSKLLCACTPHNKNIGAIIGLRRVDVSQMIAPMSVRPFSAVLQQLVELLLEVALGDCADVLAHKLAALEE